VAQIDDQLLELIVQPGAADVPASRTYDTVMAGAVDDHVVAHSERGFETRLADSHASSTQPSALSRAEPRATASAAVELLAPGDAPLATDNTTAGSTPENQ
jgi:hypothetical protein